MLFHALCDTFAMYLICMYALNLAISIQFGLCSSDENTAVRLLREADLKLMIS